MVIEDLILSLVIESLKEGISKLKSNHPIRKTISKVEKKYKDIENLSQTLNKLLESESAQNKIEEFTRGNRNINIKDMATTLVKDCGFYFGDESQEKSIEIVQNFFSFLKDEYLKSEERHIFADHRQEALAKEFLDGTKTTQSMIKETHLTTMKAILSLSSQFSLDDYKDKVQSLYTKRIDEAREILKAGKIKTAKKLFKNLLADLSKEKDVPKVLYFRTWTNLGCCELELEQLSEAIIHFEHAHNILPEDDKGLANMVTAMQLKKDYSVGLEYAEKLLKKNPHYLHGICVKAGVLAEIGKFDEAINLFKDEGGDYNSAILKDAQSCYTLGFVFYQKKDYKNAQKFFKKATNLDSSNPDFFLLQGLSICFPILQEKTLPWLVSEQTKTKLKDAEQYLSQSYKLLQEQENDKKTESVLINRSSIRIALNNLDGAISDCKDALKKNPYSLQVLKNKGIAESLKGEFDIAIEDWTKAISKYETDDDIVSMIVHAYLSKEMQEPEKGIQVIDKYISEHVSKKDYLPFLFDLTECYLQKGDFQQTDKLLNKIKKINPTNPRLLQLYSKANLKKGIVKKAEIFLLKALEKSTEIETQIFTLELADFYFNQQLYDEAIPYYESVINLSVNNEVLRKYFICLYSSSNKDVNVPKCLKLCKEIRKKIGPTKLITEIEAVIQESLNNLAEASQLYLELSKIEPEKYDHELRHGYVEFRRGNHKIAVERLEKVKDKVSKNPQALITIAQIFDYIGRKVEAIILGFDALKLEPNDPQISMAYIHLFLSRDIDGKNKLLNPRKVEKDSVVKLKINGDEKTYTLVDTKESSLGKGEISISSDFGVRLVGLKKGDKVELKEPGFPSRIVNILEIKSKYVDAFQDCIQNFNLQFPKEKGLKLVKVEKDLKSLLRMLDTVSERASKFTDLYRERNLTIGALSNLLGADLFDAWAGIISSPDLYLKCSYGSVEQQQYEINIVEKSSKITIDPIGLFTLVHLDCLNLVSNLFPDIYISQSCLDELTQIIGLQSSIAKKGFETIGKQKDQYIRREIKPKDVQNKIRLLKKIQKFIVNKTNVIGLKTPISFYEQRLVDVLGKSSFDTIRIAKENKLTIYSDDQFLRELAFNEHQIDGFEIQALLKKAQKNKFIQENDYHEKIIKLLTSRYSFLSSVNGKTILYSVKISGTGFASHEFRTLLEFVASLQTSTKSAINVLSDFVKWLWIEPIPPNIKQEYLNLTLNTLSEKRGVRDIIKSFKKALRDKFYYIPHKATEVLNLISSWEKRQLMI